MAQNALKRGCNMISIKQLCKKFGDNLILDNIDLEIDEGEIVALVGSSGGGKTTLLKCLHGIERVTSGSFILSESTGLIFQHFNLFPHMSVLENIMYMPCKVLKEKKEAVEEKAKQLLALLQIEAHANTYPASLSGGQKQRVAIARALAPSPRILLLDEPTSALDPSLTTQMANLFMTLSKEKKVTILFSSHDMDLLKKAANRVVLLANGRIVESASTTTFFTNPQTKEAREFIEHIVKTKN